MMELILASGSPRRRELLGQLGLTFRVRTADIDETMNPALGAGAEVARVSRDKALAVQPLVSEDALVLAADTVVCLEGEILGKPKNPAQAADMLRRLSGRCHLVRTGVTLLQGSRVCTEVETTEVCFRDLTEAEIAAYIRTGEPMDKAGAYGIQGLAAVFVSSIRGDYFNVMGLPLCRLSQMLGKFGVSLFPEV